MMGRSEILNPSESGVNSQFYTVLNVGGSEILSLLESGVNSRFCSVLNDGGIRNSESLRIGCK